jgi:hypothetical protein
VEPHRSQRHAGERRVMPITARRVRGAGVHVSALVRRVRANSARIWAPPEARGRRHLADRPSAEPARPGDMNTRFVVTTRPGGARFDPGALAPPQTDQTRSRFTPR